MSPTWVLGVAGLALACGPRHDAVLAPQDAGTTSADRGVVASPPVEPTAGGASRPAVLTGPVLPAVAAADRDALAATGEPVIRETPVADGIETTLVLAVGGAEVELTRAVWDRDGCEDFSAHVEVVDAAHGLVDVRINCHFGEDFWTTDVAAELVVVDVAGSTVRALWSGGERYSGAMDECATADDEIGYEVEGTTVWQTRRSWASWEPQDPRDPLVARADCVRPPSPDTRTAIATLQSAR